jgi:hypothetical protein
MACCGKKIKNIFQGHLRNIIQKTAFIPDKKCPQVNDRIYTCLTCKNKTFLTWPEFAGFLRKNIVKQKKFNLEEMGPLPKCSFHKKRNLFCRICKCLIEAKARADDETCPLGKW